MAADARTAALALLQGLRVLQAEPTLLIEYDNTQNDANHIHSVWHDPRGDFGADVLGAHYRAHRVHA